MTEQHAAAPAPPADWWRSAVDGHRFPGLLAGVDEAAQGLCEELIECAARAEQAHEIVHRHVRRSGVALERETGLDTLAEWRQLLCRGGGHRRAGATGTHRR